MTRRRPWWVTVTLVIALLGAACGGSDASDGDGGQPDKPTVAVSGGTAIAVQSVDATTLDPAIVVNNSTQGSATITAIYDALYTVDSQTYEVEPRIATDFSSDDGITWTLTLRDGVRFTDGTPFDADAVRQYWERQKGNIRAQGFSAMNVYVDTMTVVDDLTLEVRLKSVNNLFYLAVTNTSLNSVPSPTAVAEAGDDYGNQPVGAGPFMLQSRSPGSETVLVRNPDYWQEGLPKLDTLVIRTVNDPQQQNDTLTTGAADASVAVPDLYAVEDADLGYRTLDALGVGGTGWLFGVKQPPFDDIRARKAVYLALDMERLNDTINQGTGDVVTTLWPEGTPFYNPDITLPEPDPVEAQRLFDELADEGKPVSFTIINAGGQSNIWSIEVQTQLSEYDNVTVDVDPLDGSTYGLTLYSGEFDLGVFGTGGIHPQQGVENWASDYPIPIANMQSAEMDAALEAGRTATDDAGRQAAYNEVARLSNDLYRIKFMTLNHSWAVEGPDVTGLQVYGTGNPLWENFGHIE